MNSRLDAHWTKNGSYSGNEFGQPKDVESFRGLSENPEQTPLRPFRLGAGRVGRGGHRHHRRPVFADGRAEITYCSAAGGCWLCGGIRGFAA